MARALSARGRLTTDCGLNWLNWHWTVTGAGPLSVTNLAFSLTQQATGLLKRMRSLSWACPRMELIVARPADKWNIVLYFRVLVTDIGSTSNRVLNVVVFVSYQAVSVLPINVGASIGFCQAVVILSTSSQSTD